MCDYSLHGIPSRLAEKDEVLVVHRFYTGSKGLTSPESLKPIERPRSLMAKVAKLLGFQPEECAVCIPDGAKLLLHGISANLQNALGLMSVETVTFRQLSMNEYTHRDAVEFSNGIRIRLQDLEEGQSVEVLTLSSGDADVQVSEDTLLSSPSFPVFIGTTPYRVSPSTVDDAIFESRRGL